MTAKTSSLIETAIIGAGFGGLGLAIKLQQSGQTDFVIYEKAEDVGGVWRDNVYPGAACDVPSHLYSFSFEPNPDWSRDFGGQSEIYAYLRYCADKHSLWNRIRFKVAVEKLVFDEASGTWSIFLSDGSVSRARAVVVAIGALNIPSYPAIEGLKDFNGKVMHTAEWDADYDLTDKRVAVIGTGASAIQVIPSIQPQVGSLAVYQRTPPWVLPKRDGAISEKWRARYRRFPILQKLHRLLQYLQFELTAPVFLKNNWMTRLGERLGRRYLQRAVADPALRKKITPDYSIGCKRVLLSDDYYPALQQSNVDVITDGIARIDESGIVTRDGNHRELDVIVLATGFKVPVAGAPFRIEGLGGRVLDDDWQRGSEAYLGMTVNGYPNMTWIMGPNTGPGNISVIFYIESQLRYIMAYLKHLRERPRSVLDLKPSVQREFNRDIQARMRNTTWTSGCKSWYLTEDGKNTTLWPGYSWQYRMRSRRFNPSLYQSTRVEQCLNGEADVAQAVTTA